MTITKVSARWTGEGLNFIGTTGRGQQVEMGGQNISPTDMLLLGLAGCTGMDVASILQKKRQAVATVEVHVTGHRPEEYPKPYQLVEIAYVVSGDNITARDVERAIELSVTKYCIVSQTLQYPVELKTSFTVEAQPA
jgi:putative redox protein